MSARRVLGVCAVSSALLDGAVTLARGEVAVMSRERLQEAEQAGRKAVREDAILFTGTCRTKGKLGVHIYDVTVTTPFGGIAYAAFVAGKMGRPLDLAQWSIDPPGKQSVIVSVDPAALQPEGLPPAPPLSVANVILRRAGQFIEPLRADTHEVRFPGADKKHREPRGGAYYFPLGPFASELGDLEIVVIPETDVAGAEAVLKIKKADLAKLR